jgi:hypothetical protein
MPPAYNTLRILWLAFIPSHLALLGVRFMVPPTTGGGGPPDAVFVVLSLGFVVALFVVPRLAAFQRMPANTAWIIRFALAETIAVQSFALHVLGGSLPVGLGLAALGLLMHLLQVPTADRFTRWEMEREGQGGRSDQQGLGPR